MGSFLVSKGRENDMSFSNGQGFEMNNAHMVVHIMFEQI